MLRSEAANTRKEQGNVRGEDSELSGIVHTKKGRQLLRIRKGAEYPALKKERG